MTTQMEKPTEQKSSALNRKRKWLIILAVVVVVVGVLILLIPTLISTPLVKGRVVSLINGRITGNVQLIDFSTSWGGPTRLRGLQVSDPQGRKVLDVQGVYWSRGVWGALMSRFKFGQITVESPHVILHVDKDGTTSLTRAMESRTPKPAATEEKSGKLPVPIGSLVVEGGRVQIIRENVASYEVPSISGTFDVNTLNHLQGNLKVTTAEGSMIRGDFIVDQLAKDGQFTLGEAKGTVKVETTGGVEIGPLLTIATESSNAGGKLEVNLNAVLEAGQAKVDFTSRVAGLKAGQSGQENLRPVDLDLKGTVRRGEGKLTAQAVINGPPGQFESQLVYLESKQPLDFSSEKLMALILSGEKHPLPEFTLTANGKIDIPTLGKAVPALLTMQPGVEVQAGSIEINDIKVQGGNQPTAAGKVQLTQVSAKHGTREITFQPVTAGFDLTVELGQGLAIRQGTLQSEFLQASAKGTVRNLELTFQGDLAKVKHFGEVFGLLSMDFAGTVTGTTRLIRTSDEKLDVTLDLAASGFRYKTEKGLVQARQSKVSGKGSCNLKNNRIRKVSAGEVVVTIDDAVAAKGSGWYDVDQDSLHSEVNVERIDLGYAAKQAESLGAKGPQAVGGNLVLSVKADKASSDTGYVVAGNGQIDQLVVGTGDKAFQEPQIRFSSRTEFNPRKQTVALDHFELASSPLTVQVKGNIRQDREKGTVDFSGKYQASWDRLTDLVHQYSPETKETISMTGKSESDFTVRGPMANPILEGIDAKSGINWEAGKIYGLALSQAALSLLIQNARFDLPKEPIRASDGFIRTSGYIDFHTPTTLHVPGSVNLLDNIRIDKEIGQQLLSRINPIFGYVAELDGRATLRMSDLDLPLSEAIKTKGTGRGHLDLTKVRMQPAMVFGELIKLAASDLKKNYTPTISGVNFTIQNGNILYDNFTIAFPEEDFDMIFSGSVGLYDGTVNLIVSLPLKPALFAKAGLKGLEPDDAQLKGMRIGLPLVGTRTNLKVDLSNAAMRKILTESLKGAGLNPGKSIQQLLKPSGSGKQGTDQGKSPLKSLLSDKQGSSTQPSGKEPPMNKLQNLLGGEKKK